MIKLPLKQRRFCRPFFVGLIASLTICVKAELAFTTIANFNGTNGLHSEATLLRATDGNLYGTTLFGGSQFDGTNSGYGTVFKVTPQGMITLLASFAQTNGAYPQLDLIQSGTDFLGTTSMGGDRDAGTIFKITPGSGLRTSVFFNWENGSRPSSSLTDGGNGMFYGTTSSGTNDFGTVYRLEPNNSLTTLVWFNGTNGSFPYISGLVRGKDGLFYGTTQNGGAGFDGGFYSGFGTIYKMTPQGELTTLFSFNGTNGANPYGKLVQGDDGNFYGVTGAGGEDFTGGPFTGNGTVFRISPEGVLTNLVFFSVTNGGAQPFSGLAKTRDGNFYGTTQVGAYDEGIVFRVTPRGEFTRLIAFHGTNGARPIGGLTEDDDGNLYGTTSEGGAFGFGTIFKLSNLASLRPKPGSYFGLFYLKDNISTGTSGSARFAVAKNGSFSGQLRMANGSFPISGKFGSDGVARIKVPAKGRGMPPDILRIEIKLALPDHFEAVINSGNWTAALTACLPEVVSRTNRESFSLLVSSGADSNLEPSGMGHAYAILDKAGNLTAQWTLADGVRFQQSSRLVSQGRWPMYAPLYGGRGLVLGWPSLVIQDQPVTWLKPRLNAAKTYPLGFTNEVMITAFPYHAPAPGDPVFRSSNFQAIINQPGPGEPIIINFSLDARNRIIIPNRDVFRLTFSPRVGHFQGRVIDPATTKWIPFSGQFMQNPDIGYGFSIKDGQSAGVWISTMNSRWASRKTMPEQRMSQEE